MIGRRLIVLKLEIRKQLAKKNPRANVVRDDVRVFANPADTGSLCHALSMTGPVSV